MDLRGRKVARDNWRDFISDLPREESRSRSCTRSRTSRFIKRQPIGIIRVVFRDAHERTAALSIT